MLLAESIIKRHKIFTAFFAVKAFSLLFFLLQSVAFANNPNSHNILVLSQGKTRLILDTKLSSSDIKDKLKSSTASSSSTAKAVRPRLSLSRKIDPIMTELMGGLSNNSDDEEDLRIATGVQPTEKKENWIIASQYNSGNIEDQEYLEPFAGEFTPNTDEENNIILASMLIIFTGAAIIAIISYL